MQVRVKSRLIKGNLSNISVVLVNTLYPENIGSTARACANFGISNLILVNPKDLNEEKMRAMATKSGLPILENMKVFDNFLDAISEFNYVIGTTARLGKQRKVYETPREIANKIIDLSQNNKIAILFGNEKWGLTNEELYHCHTVITIPTTEKASLNVSQAVVIILYELFLASSEIDLPKPRLATVKELEVMYKIISDTLEAINYVPHDNKVLWMTTIRRFLSKIDLTAQEVRVIQGFCKQLLWALRSKN